MDERAPETPNPEDFEGVDGADVERIPLVRPPRVRATVVLAIIALSTMALWRTIPELAAQGTWDGVVLLLFGAYVLPLGMVFFLSRSPGQPVIELSSDRMRLPVTTRAHEFVTLRYRDIDSLFSRGGPTGGLLWIGTEQGTFLFPARALGSHDDVQRLLAILRGRVEESLPDATARLARFDEQQATADIAYSSPLWGTKAVLGLLALGFVYQLFAGVAEDPLGVVPLGANAPTLVLESEQLFRLVTSNLLHANELHLLTNGLLLAIVGSLVERMLGTKAFVLVALASGILGPLATVLSGRSSLTVGASAIVFGLLGAFTYTSYFHKDRMPLGFALPLRMWITLALLLAFMSLFPVGTDVPAHLGGFLAGVLAAAPFLDKQDPLPIRPGWTWPSLGVVAVLGLWAVVSVGWGVQAYLQDDGTAQTRVMADYLERQPAAPGTLNALAWVIAIRPDVPPKRLELAKTAARRAVGDLRDATQRAGAEDTLATVHYRLGEYDEAVRLEAEVLSRRDDPLMATQLARFLRGRVDAKGVLFDEGAGTSVPAFAVRYHAHRGFGLDFRDTASFEDPRTVWLLVERAGKLEGLIRLPLGPNVDPSKTLWLKTVGIEPVWYEGVTLRTAWIQPSALAAKGWLMDPEVLTYP